MVEFQTKRGCGGTIGSFHAVFRCLGEAGVELLVLKARRSEQEMKVSVSASGLGQEVQAFMESNA